MPKVLIIGGGIVGTGIAYYLTQAGIRDVMLLEKEDMLGTGATQYCSGGVRHQFTTPINVKFSLEAFKELRRFDIDYKKYGYLILDMKDDSRPRVQMQNRLGVKSEYLTAADIKARFAYLNTDGVVSGSFFAEDGIADPSRLLAIYEKGFRAGGGRILTKQEVTKIVEAGGSPSIPPAAGLGTRVVGAEVGGKILEADHVVLAAGIWSKGLGKTIGLDVPIVDKRKYVFCIDGFPFDFPVVMEIPTGWYIKKEGKQALMGMSGKCEMTCGDKQAECTEETIMASTHRFPQTEHSAIRRTLTSLSDETPDKHAVIDNSIPGLIIATGFSGHGFMHSPAVGQVVVSLIKGEKPVIDVGELKLHREHIKESIVI